MQHSDTRPRTSPAPGAFVAPRRSRRAPVVVALAAALVAAVFVPIVLADSTSAMTLMVSESPDRAGAIPLEGTTLNGSVAIFLPDPGAWTVDYYVDDPLRQDAPIRREYSPPFDLMGTARDGTAVMFDVSSLGAGAHTVTVRARMSWSFQLTATARFVVGDPAVAESEPGTQPSAPESGPTSQPPASTQPDPAPVHAGSVGGWPDASNTGPSGALTVIDGDLVLDQPGQVVTNVEVRGTILVSASNVTVRNFKAKAISNIFWYGFTNATFEDGLVDGQDSEGYCVAFGHYTLRRMELTRCGDGAKFGAHSYIYDTWIHDLWVPPGAHSDALQSTGNSCCGYEGPSVISHVWMDMPLMLGDEDSPLGAVTITNSYLGGGLWGGWNQATGTYPSALTVTGNVIADPAIYVSPSTTWSGNTAPGGSVLSIA